jgi:hypothetical protein
VSSLQQLGNHNETRRRNYTREPIPLQLQLQDGGSDELGPVDMVAVTILNHENFILLQQASEGPKIPRTPFN